MGVEKITEDMVSKAVVAQEKYSLLKTSRNLLIGNTAGVLVILVVFTFNATGAALATLGLSGINSWYVGQYQNEAKYLEEKYLNDE